MVSIKINCDEIKDSKSFHVVFKSAFGFPEFYGENMNAWIDCMSDLDNPEAGMTKVHCEKGDFFLLELNNVKTFKEQCPRQYEDLIECSAFVNHRRMENGENPLIMLSFYS